MDPIEPYQGREASAVKHAVLKGYVERLAYKIGSSWPTLNYVEGFAGPWKATTEDLSDTSPHIAIAELRAAREGLRKIGKTPRIRCLFVEKGKRAAAMLAKSVERYDDVETRVLQGAFLEKIPRIVEFVTAAPRPFTFIFVDPNGWTGFDPSVLVPLLRTGDTEIVITFMTKDIVRFINHPNEKIRRSFDPLFESREERTAWSELRGQAREDAIVDAFRRWMKKLGSYKYVVSAVVLHPTRNRTHFHLVYCTRSLEGLRTFRQVERRTLGFHKSVRETARQRARTEKTGQPSMFDAGTVESVSYVDELRSKYHDFARQAVLDQLSERDTVPFEELEETALLHPMTSSRELKRWLDEWKVGGMVKYTGLAPGKRTLKLNKGHRVVWIPT
jgi:three-Cys-motif partner protein